MFIQTYGVGGFCENCDPAHDHPFGNVVATVEVPDGPPDAGELARATLSEPLSILPVQGETVEDVRSSADAAIADLATQLETRLNLIVEGTE